MSALAIPTDLQPYAGRMLDVDAHEMMPVDIWTAAFGDVVSDLVDIYKAATDSGSDAQSIAGYKADDTAINADTVWKTKGPRAPSSTDMGRRDRVLDLIGVARQLVFPTAVGLHWSHVENRKRGAPVYTTQGHGRPGVLSEALRRTQRVGNSGRITVGASPRRRSAPGGQRQSTT